MTEVITLSDDDDDVPMSSSPGFHPVPISIKIKEGAPLDVLSLLNNSSNNGSSFGRIEDYEMKYDVQNGQIGNKVPVARPLPVMDEIITLDDDDEDENMEVASVSQPIKFAKPYVPPSNIPVRIPRPDTMSASEKESFMRLFLFEAVKKHSMFDRTNRKKLTTVKFFCSFGYDGNQCNKLINGQIQYMYHLWTHAALDDLPKKNDEKLDRGSSRSRNQLELAKLSSCPQCCRYFKSPFLATTHYHKCHGKELKYDDGVCPVCEREIGKVCNLKEHMKLVLNEAPYVCNICSYRSSTRTFLLKHVAKEHAFDPALICPLCCKCIRLPSNFRNRPQVHCEDYVKHMMAHGEAADRSYHCDKCALIFISEADLIEHKRVDHGPVGKGFTIKMRKRLLRRTRSVSDDPQSQIKKLEHVYTSTKEGVRVHDEVACSSSLERSGYDTSVVSKMKHTCACGFQTHNGNRLASHFHRCGQPFTSIKEVIPKLRKNTWEEEEDEAILFGYHPEVAAKEPEVERIYESQEELKMMDLTAKPKISTEAAVRLLKATTDKKDWKNLVKELRSKLE